MNLTEGEAALIRRVARWLKEDSHSRLNPFSPHYHADRAHEFREYCRILAEAKSKPEKRYTDDESLLAGLA